MRTGAKIPAGSDTVLMQEDCRLGDGVVVIPPGIQRGCNRRKQGEDIAAGSVILQTGTRLRTQDLGLAASIGRPTLPVSGPVW